MFGKLRPLFGSRRESYIASSVSENITSKTSLTDLIFGKLIDYHEFIGKDAVGIFIRNKNYNFSWSIYKVIRKRKYLGIVEMYYMNLVTITPELIFNSNLKVKELVVTGELSKTQLLGQLITMVLDNEK